MKKILALLILFAFCTNSTCFAVSNITQENVINKPTNIPSIKIESIEKMKKF